MSSKWTNLVAGATQVNASKGRIFASAIDKEVDINYKGILDGSEGIIRTKQGCHNNRVLFWLTSKPCSYVREGSKGGKLYELLGKHLTPEVCSNAKIQLEAAFKKEFTDVELLYLDISYIPTERSAVVEMWCRDSLYGETFDVEITVEEETYEGW